jgi:hypothetical protein
MVYFHYSAFLSLPNIYPRKFFTTVFLTFLVTTFFLLNIPNVQATQTKPEVNVKELREEFKSLTDDDLRLEEINNLKISLALQETQIKHIERMLNNKNIEIENGMSFEVWIGVVLACIAVLLTILGLGIGILSIFGYKKVIGSATSAAEAAAITKTVETVKEIASSATQEEIIKLIDKGSFDKIISHAVETVVYRGINPLEDFDKDENL